MSFHRQGQGNAGRGLEFGVRLDFLGDQDRVDHVGERVVGERAGQPVSLHHRVGQERAFPIDVNLLGLRLLVEYHLLVGMPGRQEILGDLVEEPIDGGNVLLHVRPRRLRLAARELGFTEDHDRAAWKQGVLGQLDRVGTLQDDLHADVTSPGLAVAGVSEAEGARVSKHLLARGHQAIQVPILFETDLRGQSEIGFDSIRHFAGLDFTREIGSDGEADLFVAHPSRNHIPFLQALEVDPPRGGVAE